MAKKTINKHKKIITSSIFAVFLIFALLIGSINFGGANTQILENAFFTDTIYTSTSGKVKETLIANYTVFTELTELEKTDLISTTFTLFSDKKTELLDEYSNKLSAETPELQAEYSGKVSIAAEVQEENVVFIINFDSQEVWQYFTSISGYSYTPLINQGFFTYTRYDRQEMIGAVTTLAGIEEYFGEYLKFLTYDLVNAYDDTILPSTQIASAYTYVTPYRKRHSNATEIASVNSVFYHQWNTTAQSDIVFYTTVAKVEVWYIMSLAMAFLVISIILLISYFKKPKRDTKELVSELQDIIEKNEKAEDEPKKERIKTKDE